MSETLRLGTRGSQLARTQSQWVADRITEATGRPVVLVIIRTKGDRVTDRPLSQVGGKGLFTKELEDALLAGDVDLAVHSMKDMPTDQPDGLIFGAIPVREDPRDVLVGARLADLPAGAVVGTGSERRQAQLQLLRPDIELRGIRGNVDTRIQKQRDGEYAAVVLAAAGIARLGRSAEVTDFIAVEDMIPAVGQGALALQCREGDVETIHALSRVHDPATAICVKAERAFLIELQGGCSVPAGAHAILDGQTLNVLGFYEDRRASVSGTIAEATAMGTVLAKQLAKA